MTQPPLFAEPTTELIVCTDGGARGNPGPAAIGVSICNTDGDEVDAVAQTIGEATNNVAEYTAVIVGLRRAAELGARAVEVRSDSMLLVEQLNGRYKVRKDHLKLLVADARAAASAFEQVRFVHVRREQNTRADALVNEALDAEGGWE